MKEMYEGFQDEINAQLAKRAAAPPVAQQDSPLVAALRAEIVALKAAAAAASVSLKRRDDTISTLKHSVCQMRARIPAQRAAVPVEESLSAIAVLTKMADDESTMKDYFPENSRRSRRHAQRRDALYDAIRAIRTKE